MILVAARVTVKPGMEAACETLCVRLMSMVREAERIHPPKAALSGG